MSNNTAASRTTAPIPVLGDLIHNWGWPLIGGIAAIFLGFMILARWPISGLWVIGLFVAIELILSGWSYIFIALAVKEVGRQNAPGA